MVIVGLAACRTASEPDLQKQATLIVRANVAAATITTLVVEVTAPDITTPLVFNMTVENGVASATIEIPTGSDRTITIRAFNANDIETHRGSATVDIVADANPTLNVTLLPLTGELPIDVVIGSFTVTVDPAEAVLNVGGTIQLTATIRDANDDPVEDDVQWATLNPAVAAVDLSGLVTAVAGGATEIVATYAGVGGSATVTVTPIILFDETEFLTASNAEIAVTYPNVRAVTSSPYVENGVTFIARNEINDFTPVLPDNEFGISGIENVDLTFDWELTAFGLWMQDGFEVGEIRADGVDSRFRFTIISGTTTIASVDVDPPIDVAFFLGIISGVPFDRVEIRELDPASNENDFFGRIYTFPGPQL
jgi:hypothetical protein